MNDPVKTSARRQSTRHMAGFAPYIMMLYVGLLFLTSGLRFYKLDTQSFWNDEGNSARLSERSLSLIIEGTASDVHPPLYYVMLHGWRELLGDGEFGLRSFSTFAGILTVAAAISLTRNTFLFSDRNSIITISLLTGLLATLNPTLVYYSQETRMYALLALISTLSTLVLFRWLNSGRPWQWAVGYIFLSTAGLYTHYFYPIMFVVQGIIILSWLSRKYITLVFAPLKLTAEPKWSQVPAKWLFMVGISVVLYLPWVPVFLRQTTGRAPERASIPSFLWDSLRWMTFGSTISDEELIWVTCAVLLLLTWAIITRGRHLIIPFFGVLLPVAAMYIAGTTNPAFFKFMIISIPFFLMWLAASLGDFRRTSLVWWVLQKIISYMLILTVMGGMLFSLRNLYQDPAYARADYRAMVAAITAAEGENTGIILNAPNQWEVFTYYYQGDFPVYPLPKGQPDPLIIEPQLAEIANNHELLYALYWGDTQRDPQHIVENWLDYNTFKVSESWVGDVRFVIYSTPTELIEQRMPLNINFDDKIFLHSVAIAGDKVVPGDIIQLTFEWSSEEILEDRYKVFIHLIDKDGEIIAQQDSEPAGGTFPTTAWLPRDVVVDKHGVVLPETIMPGEYQLLLGLYEISNPNARLPIKNLAGNQDYFNLGTIVIE